jgi:hypothetical protein
MPRPPRSAYRSASGSRTYFFTDQLEAVLTDVRRVERWLCLLATLALATALIVALYRRNAERKQS